MTEDQVLALISTALAAAKSEIMSEVTRSNQGLAASLSKEIKKLHTPQPAVEEDEATNSSGEGKLTLKALQQQIADLTTQLEAKDKKAFEAEKTSAIASLIAASGTQQKSTLQKLFALQYGDSIKKEGDSWFFEKDGTAQTLDAVFKSYLESEEGSIFLPPSTVDGSGSKETKAVVPPTTQASGDSISNALVPLSQLVMSGQL
ncbi:hypothetical protein H6F88_31665 [Oculatella sp. FACHB-28]|uniref:hypothetical protein n=1 Tax=Oculatella sp. FACHB-28 TaxID=2692845 RepID=UPI00168931ED|nr:hypothetical protein [Oculatella sp. FACHB-28]MBD2060501.1 hypothetical protein [Oculatella sp. FACHB-28]